MSANEIYVVLCSGHSGSRMLVRVLIENGVFMGKYRGAVGEDEERFGRLLWHDGFQEHFVASWKYPDEKRLSDEIQNRLRQCHEEFIKDLGPAPALPKAIGFKNATLFPYVAKPYRQSLEGLGDRVKFIHLTRDPFTWMLSGKDANSRGIIRPIRHPKFSQLSRPFNRIVWFGSLADQVSCGRRTISVSDHQVYGDEEQTILEAMFWRTTNQLCYEFSSWPEEYLHLQYEDLVNRPELALDRLGQFIGAKLQVPQSGGAKILRDRVSVESQKMLGAANCAHIVNICGDLMKKVGYSS